MQTVWIDGPDRPVFAPDLGGGEPLVPAGGPRGRGVLVRAADHANFVGLRLDPYASPPEVPPTGWVRAADGLWARPAETRADPLEAPLLAPASAWAALGTRTLAGAAGSRRVGWVLAARGGGLTFYPAGVVRRVHPVAGPRRPDLVRQPAGWEPGDAIFGT